MGMRLDLRVAGKSGGGCRSGMADKCDSPRFAGLRGLEESLRFHREAQAAPAPAKPRGRMAASNAPDSPVRAAASVAEPDDIDDLFVGETSPEAVHPVLRRRRP